MKLNKNGLSYALEYMHDKIYNNNGKIIVISILLLFFSMICFLAFIDGAPIETTRKYIENQGR